jgi:hypothetical protein
MSDPVVDAHRLLPRLYRISGGMTPVSIRDQMIRGWLLVERLRRRGEFSENSRLLVVGAGASGATAAMWAANKKIKTLLVEENSAPFLSQKLAPTRVLDPTQYDWPVDHWPLHAFPWVRRHARMPLPYPASEASILSAMWELELQKAVKTLSPFLTFDPNTEMIEIDPDASRPKLDVKFRGDRSRTETFDNVIWAGGPGQEQCRLYRSTASQNPDPIYQGRAFWSRDPFTKPDCGVQGQARVLITGTGDGGLQDYLRVVTREESAEKFYRSLNIPQEVAAAIQSAEDRAHRARTWVDESPQFRSRHERPILAELHKAHEAAVETALNVKDVQQSLDFHFGFIPTHTLLIGREAYFTNYYGLNRFLVLIVSRYLEKSPNHQTKTVRLSTTITDLSTPDGHKCTIELQGIWGPVGGIATPVCHGLDHDVTLRDQHGNLAHERFNVIIVRYGLKIKDPPVLTAKDPQQNQQILVPYRPRHLLPYHIPR